jgi:hypothetical protein
VIYQQFIDEEFGEFGQDLLQLVIEPPASTEHPRPGTTSVPSVSTEDRWRRVREGQLFNDVRSYLIANSAIKPRLVLSQHFSQSCQPKEDRRLSERTSLRQCGLDNVKECHNVSLRWYVELEFPYGYVPGDPFRFQYVSDFYASELKAKDGACFDIATVLFLRHPLQMRVKYATAMKNGIQARDDICRMVAGLSGDEDDALTLACGSGRSPDEAAVARATVFVAGTRLKDMYQPGHSDDEVHDVLFRWSRNGKFREQCVEVLKCFPRNIVTELASMVQHGGLRAFLRRYPQYYAIIQDKPLVFRCFSLHGSGGGIPPSGAVPSGETGPSGGVGPSGGAGPSEGWNSWRPGGSGWWSWPEGTNWSSSNGKWDSKASSSWQC